MGKYAINLLNEKLGTKFSEDEAGFIALHFVNAEYDTTINDTFAMTNMIQGILELVKQEMGIEFDEESLHYESMSAVNILQNILKKSTAVRYPARRSCFLRYILSVSA